MSLSFSMLTKTTRICLFIFSLSSTITVSAQSIAPFTLNIGGGTYLGVSNQFDWSIGEGSSIGYFAGSRNLFVTSGVLQPFTEAGAVLVFTVSPWAKEELLVFPVPTPDILEVDIKIAERGLITMNLFDQLGQMILTRQFYFDGVNNRQKIDLTRMVAGVYYLNVTMGGAVSDHLIRKGSFKIVKL